MSAASVVSFSPGAISIGSDSLTAFAFATDHYNPGLGIARIELSCSGNGRDDQDQIQRITRSEMTLINQLSYSIAVERAQVR
jgi:hypothetical protein